MFANISENSSPIKLFNSKNNLTKKQKLIDQVKSAYNLRNMLKRASSSNLDNLEKAPETNLADNSFIITGNYFETNNSNSFNNNIDDLAKTNFFESYAGPVESEVYDLLEDGSLEETGNFNGLVNNLHEKDNLEVDLNSQEINSINIGNPKDKEQLTSNETEKLVSINKRGEKFKSIRCPYCNKLYTNELYFKFHLNKKHNQNLLSCYICKRVFLADQLEEHIDLVHNNKCPVENCDFKAPYKKDLIEHKQKMHRPAKAKKIKINLKEKESKEEALNVRSKLNLKCPKCHKTFSNNRSLNCHKKCDEKFSCEICKKTYPTQAFLKNHKKEHDDIIDKILRTAKACRICGKVCKNNRIFNEHILTEHKDTYKCLAPRCNKRYDNKDDLKNHIISQHKNLSDEWVNIWLNLKQ